MYHSTLTELSNLFISLKHAYHPLFPAQWIRRRLAELSWQFMRPTDCYSRTAFDSHDSQFNFSLSKSLTALTRTYRLGNQANNAEKHAKAKNIHLWREKR